MTSVFKGVLDVHDALYTTLSRLTRSGWRSNPAMRTLLGDYARYHYVLVGAGACLVLLFAALAIVFWRRVRTLPKASVRAWSFEKKTYFSFAVLSSAVAALIALLVVANATNAAAPLHGFALLVDSATTPNRSLHHVFYHWLQSGDGHVPAGIEKKIHERIVFQTVHIVEFGLLLAESVALSVILFRYLIRTSRASASRLRFKERTYVVAGGALVAVSLVSMLIVVANLQGALAPITITLFRV